MRNPRAISWMRASPAAFAAALILLIWAVAAPSRVLAQPVPDRAKSLPKHLGLGVESGASNLGWMTESKVPWDYRYQYLTGGVNTDEGWATWNSPAGAYAERYIQASRANRYIPVFTFYQIVPSKPDPGSENLSKLTEAATMRAYYEDWQLLMRKLGADGKTVIVHVEPDLWAHMRRANTDPTRTRVAVASSRFPAASGSEDNARGFAKLLVALRDEHAPHALLAWHVNPWAAEGSLTKDAPAAGKQVAAFYRALGAPFDLAFFSLSDRDAGFDRGWWDTAHFESFRTFLGAVTRETRLPAMLWQMPVGNTLYRSVNNTKNHYQDNRVEYFLKEGNRKHLIDYANAGVIGILIGAGRKDQTHFFDQAGDGVTNPPPVNGNDRMATYPDDDGGFVRLSGKAYYDAGPVRRE